jgi:hypothetical protein
VAYLDGRHPSVIFSRGYYTRSVLASFDFDGAHLRHRWTFNSDQAGPNYAGQGNHQMSVVDVDSDGKDEIVFGSMTVDDDGSPLYSTKLGHGDALHVSDFDPSHPGQEVFASDENMTASGNRGATFRDAATGRILYAMPSERDTGRGVADDIDPTHPGAEAWAVTKTGWWDAREGELRAADGTLISETIPAANHMIWWDADPLREILNHRYDETTGVSQPYIAKWDWKENQEVPLLQPTDAQTNNGTKGNPVLQADLFGDWREEVIYRSDDSTRLRLFTTTDPTGQRLRTLMHDPQYRLGVAWQNVGYNQPPHPSFFLGAGMKQPPRPAIHYAP